MLDAQQPQSRSTRRNVLAPNFRLRRSATLGRQDDFERNASVFSCLAANQSRPKEGVRQSNDGPNARTCEVTRIGHHSWLCLELAQVKKRATPPQTITGMKTGSTVRTQKRTTFCKYSYNHLLRLNLTRWISSATMAVRGYSWPERGSARSVNFKSVG